MNILQGEGIDHEVVELFINELKEETGADKQMIKEFGETSYLNRQVVYSSIDNNVEDAKKMMDEDHKVYLASYRPSTLYSLDALITGILNPSFHSNREASPSDLVSR